MTVRRTLWRRVRTWRSSVRLRVTVTAAVVFAIALGAGAAVLLQTLENRLVDDIERADRAVLFGQAAALSPESLPPETATPLPGGEADAGQPPSGGTTGEIVGTSYRISRIDGTPIVVSYHGTSVATSDGGPVFQSMILDDGSASATSAALPRTLPPAVVDELGVAASGTSMMVSTLQTPDGLTFVTASSLSQVERTLDGARTLLWLVVPALVALVAASAWFLVGRALRPVHGVTSRVAAIGLDSLHERVPIPDSGDEIGELATTMNSMLARLELASTSNRRLVSDASHELRTPIAVMRAEIEVARRQRDELSATDWDAVSGRLLGEVDRLQRLVDDLLLLARLDERPPPSARFSLVDVAREVTARRRRVPVDLADEPPHDLLVDGDEDGIRRVIDHLVANAARHAGQRVEVELDVADPSANGSATTSGSAVHVHVDDDGPGIPAAARGIVFERFVRLDEARSRDAGGSGLGLAVAADVAAMHGGTVTITDGPLGGARVTLTLPYAAPVPDA